MVPAALRPVGEVLPHHHRTDVQGIHQHLMDELVRKQPAELQGERQNAEHVDPELLHELCP